MFVGDDELMMHGLVLDQHRDLGTLDWRWGDVALHHPSCISLAFRAVRWGIGERWWLGRASWACLIWITTN